VVCRALSPRRDVNGRALEGADDKRPAISAACVHSSDNVHLAKYFPTWHEPLPRLVRGSGPLWSPVI
jgi:hypothetical protein